jgi:holo-ACP synthase CitX
MAVDCDPLAIKRSCIAIEEGSLHGRLYDIDVFSVDGKLVSRIELNVPSRRCFVCSDDASVCIRSQKHSAIEIQEVANRYFQAYERCSGSCIDES